MGKLKIYVYAICKNEEKFVEDWVASMKEADQIIVTDTGSEDGTVEKLRELGVEVFVEKVDPWRFDVARNLSLAHVPEDADVCVCTDLDERFDPGWRKQIEEAWSEDLCQGKYLYNWSLNEDGTPFVQFTYFKIHTRKEFMWKYPCHEVLNYIGKRPFKEKFIEKVVLNHYPDATKSRGTYLPLLKMAVDEMPKDDRMNYYYGRELVYHAQWDLAIKVLTNYLSLDSAIWKEERGAAMRQIALCYSMLNNFKEAYTWYYRAIAEVSWMREGYVEFAKFAYRMADFKTTYFMACEALKIKEKSSVYINDGDAWSYTPYDLASIGAFYIGLYDTSYEYAKEAVSRSPEDKRLKDNLKLIEGTLLAMKEKKTG